MCGQSLVNCLVPIFPPVCECDSQCLAQLCNYKNYQSFLSLTEGAEFPYLTIKEQPNNPNERGVFTQQKQSNINETDSRLPPFTSIIPMGTCVMRIPWHMLITVELAKQESLVCRAMHHEEKNGYLDIAVPMHAYIAAFLLEDRRLNTCSRFRSYYDTLPQSLPHLPLFWPESQLNSLLSSSFVSQQVSDLNSLNFIFKL